MSDRLNIFNFNGTAQIRDLGDVHGHGKRGDIKQGRFAWWPGNEEILVGGRPVVVKLNSLVDWLKVEEKSIKLNHLSPLTKWTFICERGTHGSELQGHVDAVLQNLKELSIDLNTTQESWAFHQGKAEFEAGQYERAAFHLKGFKNPTQESSYMLGVSYLESSKNAKGVYPSFKNPKRIQALNDALKGPDVSIRVNARLKLGEAFDDIDFYRLAAQDDPKAVYLALVSRGDNKKTEGDQRMAAMETWKLANPGKYKADSGLKVCSAYDKAIEYYKEALLCASTRAETVKVENLVKETVEAKSRVFK